MDIPRVIPPLVGAASLKVDGVACSRSLPMALCSFSRRSRKRAGGDGAPPVRRPAGSSGWGRGKKSWGWGRGKTEGKNYSRSLREFPGFWRGSGDAFRNMSIQCLLVRARTAIPAARSIRLNRENLLKAGNVFSVSKVQINTLRGEGGRTDSRPTARFAPGRG